MARFLREQAEEFEADQFASDLFSKLCRNQTVCLEARSSPDFVFAPWIFFEVLDLCYAVYELEKSTTIAFDTHPAPGARRDALMIEGSRKARGLHDGICETLQNLKIFAEDHFSKS